MKQLFKETGLTKLKTAAVLKKNKNFNFSVTGKKERYCEFFNVQLIFEQTSFSLYIDPDSDVVEEVIKIQYPQSYPLTDLAELVKADIENELERKGHGNSEENDIS